MPNVPTLSIWKVSDLSLSLLVTGGVQQLEAISSLLQQTQQLQQLQAMQQRLANGDEEGGAMGGVPAQISNVEPVSHNPQPTIFNEVC